MPSILYLIDGHALAYRTYFALTSGTGAGFRTRDGEPTAGVFGFTSVLLRILEQENPEYLAVAFDMGRTFRDDLFADYKGTRDKMPDDLQIQMRRIRQLVDAFNIPRLEKENYEADDVLGSVARQVVERGLGVKIITGDRDLLQLVNKRVVVSLPGKSLSDSKDYQQEDVEEYLGVRPDQVVDYKALVGDKSDNIPGVSGVGEKTAASLLKTYETLDNIYQHLEELPAGVQKKLKNDQQSAYLSRELARIVVDLDIPLDLEQARSSVFDLDKVESLFRELEFRTLLARLNELAKSYGKQIPVKGQQLGMFDSAPPKMVITSKPEIKAENSSISDGILVNTPEKLEALVRELSAASVIAFDTETTSTDQMQAKLVGISLAVEPSKGYYIPVGHSDAQVGQLPLKEVIEALRNPLTNPRIPKVGHNLKYDFVVLKRNGLEVKPLGFDSMIAEWLTNPESRNLGLEEPDLGPQGDPDDPY